jgi:hypothetical protein
MTVVNRDGIKQSNVGVSAVKLHCGKSLLRRVGCVQTRETLFKGIVQMTLPKSIELKWHCEVIERWLNTPGIPSEAREGLLDMQREVDEEMKTLEQSRNFSS